jgi:hypothetical protein
LPALPVSFPKRRFWRAHLPALQRFRLVEIGHTAARQWITSKVTQPRAQFEYATFVLDGMEESDI